MAETVKWIELLGLPGAGKTSLSNGQINWPGEGPARPLSLLEARYRASRKALGAGGLSTLAALLPGRMKRRICLGRYKNSNMPFDACHRFIARHTTLTRIIAQTVVDRQLSEGDREWVFSWFFRLFADYQLIEEALGAPEGVVIDEGFCNRVITLFGYGVGNVDQREIDAYIEAIPLPQIVCVIKADPKLCEERMAKRGYPQRLRNLSCEKRLAVLQHCSTCVEMAVNALTTRGVYLSIVDNTASHESAIKQFADSLCKS